MKVPSLDKTESVLVIGLACIAAYLVYRVYNAAGSGLNSISSAVSQSVGNVVSGVTNAWDEAALAIEKAKTAVGGAATPPIADQSQAESDRLSRQNGVETSGDYWDTGAPDYDPNGIYQGYFAPSSVKPQTYSPDAGGSI